MAGPWEMFAQQSAPQPQPSGPDWAADLSRKDQAELKMKMYQDGLKRLAEANDAVAQGGAVMADLEEFGRLNRQNSTGSWWQQLTPDKSMFRTDDSMRMAAITKRLAPLQRPAGSGATSDKDMAIYLSSLPSVENEGPANRGIREDYQRRYEASVAKANAMKEHLNKFGNLNDFDTTWAQRKQQPLLQVPKPQSNVDDLVKLYGSKK